VLLAALDARRPTRDIDLTARALENSAETILAVVKKIADTPIDDGVKFESGRATAEVIREDADYSGIRVTLSGVLSRAVVHACDSSLASCGALSLHEGCGIHQEW
jgi:hypothetical protein